MSIILMMGTLAAPGCSGSAHCSPHGAWPGPIGERAGVSHLPFVSGAWPDTSARCTAKVVGRAWLRLWARWASTPTTVRAALLLGDNRPRHTRPP